MSTCPWLLLVLPSRSRDSHFHETSSRKIIMMHGISKLICLKIPPHPWKTLSRLVTSPMLRIKRKQWKCIMTIPASRHYFLTHSFSRKHLLTIAFSTLPTLDRTWLVRELQKGDLLTLLVDILENTFIASLISAMQLQLHWRSSSVWWFTTRSKHFFIQNLLDYGTIFSPMSNAVLLLIRRVECCPLVRRTLCWELPPQNNQWMGVSSRQSAKHWHLHDCCWTRPSRPNRWSKYPRWSWKLGRKVCNRVDEWQWRLEEGHGFCWCWRFTTYYRQTPRASVASMEAFSCWFFTFPGHSQWDRYTADFCLVKPGNIFLSLRNRCWFHCIEPWECCTPPWCLRGHLYS